MERDLKVIKSNEFSEDGLEHQWRIAKGHPGAGQYCSKDHPFAESIPGTEGVVNAQNPAQSSQNTQKQDEKTIWRKALDDEYNDFQRMKKHEEVSTYATKKAQEAEDNKIRDVKGITDEGRNITNNLAGLLQERKGSKRVNNRDYSDISDDELRKRVNRISLERQYGDLTGDTKYEMTTKEKGREFLQTLGAILGVTGSALSIALLIKHLKNKAGS